MNNECLTEREKWLMRQAWIQAQDDVDTGKSSYQGINEWLDDSAADGGITVEMVLTKEAPIKTRDAHVL